MDDRVKIALVTASQVLPRLLGRIMERPVGSQVRQFQTILEAVDFCGHESSVLVIDLKTPAADLSELLKRLIQNAAPPTILLGETWHLPAWLKDRLGRRLVFCPYPLDPRRVDRCFGDLLASIDDDRRSAAPATLPPAQAKDHLEELLASLEVMVGEKPSK